MGKKKAKRSAAKRIKINCKGSGLCELSKLKIIQGELKTLSPQNEAKLRKRIEQYGFDAPFFVWRKKILDGTQRKIVLDKMIEDGWTLPAGKVPVCEIKAKNLNNAKQRLLGYVSQYGKLDSSGLDDFLKGIEVPDLGTIDLPDFDFEKFDAKFLNPREGLTDPDAVPDPPKKPKTKPGDLYLLGDHRLLCGDATKVKDVERVMGGEKADMVFTDPPYNVGYQDNESAESLKKRHRRTDGKIVSNDSMSNKDFAAFLQCSFELFPLRKGGVFYSMAPAGPSETIFRNVINDAHGLTLKQCLVWVKDAFVFGRQDYHYRHESMLYGWADGASHYFLDDRTQDTCWEIERPRISKHHPTMKPVELCSRAIANSSVSGEAIYDPFLGSGTTLIAAEKLNRKCYGLEIDPTYCDVIVKRWEDFTGNKAKRVRGNCG